ncbi:minor tail protein [Gordonia phage Finkle]|uniref:Minor tail protein n=1 Tax=Gordonia phage Finkle TaxID=2926099 RepID=A0A9E7NIM9_9CAUD|nr:minor tail protein [Gordonia phage Finkle]UTN92937.1 minor tail protein [Gordonia phage Finkle]
MIGYYLIGCRGARFDLSEPGSVVRLVDDPDGIYGPPTKAAMQENVGQGGAYYKGQQDAPNPIEFRYRFGGASSEIQGVPELYEAASEWAQNLGTGRELAEFHVVDEVAGTDRWQWVRNLDRRALIPRAAIRDYQYWGKGQITVTSDSSYWESEPLDVDALATSTITNRGDFPAWAQWEITGPTNGLKIGLDGDQIALANLTAGQVYRIDTDPTCPRIARDGVDAWAVAAGRQSFRKPARIKLDDGTPQATPISIAGTAAAVRLVLPQQHWAAIG